MGEMGQEVNGFIPRYGANADLLGVNRLHALVDARRGAVHGGGANCYYLSELNRSGSSTPNSVRATYATTQYKTPNPITTTITSLAKSGMAYDNPFRAIARDRYACTGTPRPRGKV